MEVHWSGYTAGYQGKRIDNTSVRDEPYRFLVGSGQVIFPSLPCGLQTHTLTHADATAVHTQQLAMLFPHFLILLSCKSHTMPHALIPLLRSSVTSHALTRRVDVQHTHTQHNTLLIPHTNSARAPNSQTHAQCSTPMPTTPCWPYLPLSRSRRRGQPTFSNVRIRVGS